MPDWARTRGGRVFPIRSSPGYETAFEGLTEKDKAYLRDAAEGTRKGYTHTADRAERAERAAAVAAERSAGVVRKGARLAPYMDEYRFVKKHKSRLY